MRPLPYKYSNGAVILGQYQVAHRSGAIAATPGALDVWARVRWAPAQNNAKFVLTRLRVGMTAITAVTTAVQLSLQASIARSFSVDFSTAITNTSMVGDSGKMHKNMGSSLFGAAGPGICTTAPCTGMTYTLDAAPFGYAVGQWVQPSSSTGTAVLVPVGSSVPAAGMMTLYDWATMGGHPPTLSTFEGIAIQTTLAGHASGTLALQAEWSWAEAINPFGND